jgi:hypothetical protein
MGDAILVTTGSHRFRADLLATPTARAIAAALPVKGRAGRWGGEIYFPVAIDVELEENARDVVQAGDLAYWPPGGMFCVFFGPTPVTKADEIRAASPVNVFGRIDGALDALWDIADGAEVSISLSVESA